MEKMIARTLIGVVVFICGLAADADNQVTSGETKYAVGGAECCSLSHPNKPSALSDDID